MKLGKICRIIKKLIYYFFSITLFRYAYKKKYIKGKHFNSIRGEGWHWIFRGFFFQKILGINRDIPWPVAPGVKIYLPEKDNIIFHSDDLNNFQTNGTYFQAIGKIIIGKGSYIAPNVGIITANHDLKNLDKHSEVKDVVLGEKCWIGMNSVILPGVVLGDSTIVGAGSVVTKSFMEGNCIIAGNPAKVIKKI